MGLERHGVIADGNVADLLLVQGDPTEDILKAADKRFHVAVLRNGEVAAGALPL
jgi:imidazolonepropionase-like amidohydrolase